MSDETRIELEGELVLSGDELQWTLAKRSVVQSGKNEGEIRERPIGYYSSLESVLKAVLERRLRLAGATDGETLLAALTSAHQEITALLRLPEVA